MATDAWYLDHRLVAALRVDQRAVIIDATTGMADLLGTSVDDLRLMELADFCTNFLGGSAGAADLWHLPADDDSGISAQLVDRDGNLRQLRVHAGESDGESRTLLFADTTALISAQDHLVRRNAHDRVLHILVSDLLDDATRATDEIVRDVLVGFSEYFEFVTSALIATVDGTPRFVAYVSADGVERATFERLSGELGLIEVPDVDQLLEVTGPGDTWHVALDQDDRYALGVPLSSLTCISVTVPYHDDEELSFVAALAGRMFPPKTDLDLIHKALSHLAQFLRRTTAEERIRRQSALEEALTNARTQLSLADPAELLAALRMPAERIAAITRSMSPTITPAALVPAHLRDRFGDWTAPRPVSPESLGLDRGVQGTWAVPVTDGQTQVALLSYIAPDPATAPDTATAFNRLIDLVPGTSIRAETERRLEAAFHNAPVGIALRDDAGRLIDCNDAFVRLVDAANATALRGTVRSDLVDKSALDEEAAAHLDDTDIIDQLELPFRRGDGSLVWGRMTSTAVDEPSGAVLLDHVEDVTATRATQAALQTERTRDALTGLLNRSEIEAVLAHRLDHDEPITVTAIDLDHFSTVNASLGHIAGDRLLQLVAERLRVTVGPEAELARTGGDEFIVVSATASQQLGLDVAQRMLAAVRQPFTLDDSELMTGASIGVCIGRGDTTPSELLLSATEALNQAKRSGRNRIVHHQSTGDPRRVGLFESELRRAVTERSLEVYYQPEFDTDTKLIVGAEALVRWHHPTDGLLAAGAFVPLAEELGLSSELSDHVLREATQAAVEWQESMAPNPFKIRINLSPRDIEAPNVVERVLHVVEETKLPMSSLCLEVTESAVMRDQRRVVRHLHQLSDLGISLAIDDFGTGFSSLWLLRELPFDTLKIDQAFIAALDSGELTDRAIVETIVNLGTTLGMEITAEGVETDSQLEVLQSIGIKRAQGFLLARPQPKAQVVESITAAAMA